ncbi:right-handed parallel beta-helix repeat-containing protein, partial [Pseudomonas oryzihabitans]|uniref:right-handed parallel beta-helix repeat-containing protein n=1 Tax=Pseudomonas oryzihabitans TaxID=47885 RepID=UPI003C6E632D
GLPCLSFPAAAATYYVATTGADTNPGTILQPFKTVEKLTSVMIAGDIGYLRGGTYTSARGNGTFAHVFLNAVNGNAGSLIKIWA